MAEQPQHDAVVVGAGFGGLASLYFLKNQGLNVKGIESAPDVGGTWYWNQYPGCRSDSESYIYRLSLDKELLQTAEWKHNYTVQSEIMAYFQAFARRNGLYDLLQFNTELKAATWDDENGFWTLTTGKGETLTTRYIVASLGILTIPYVPKIPGLESFKGKVVHSARWTRDHDSYTTKRVGVLGCGASGVQLVGALSETASHLTHFIRHPQFVLPAKIRSISNQERSLINARYDWIWTNVFTSAVAMGFLEPNRGVMSVSAEDREQIFQDLWDEGSGFRFMFSGFGDIGMNEDANRCAIDFIHRKIKATVKDPQKVKALTSQDWFGRRPLTDDRYYPAFNQSNVAAVDLKETPIEEVTSEGIKTSDGKVHELDLIILATGFDPVDGSYYRIDFKGKDNATLPEQWKDGPATTLGLQTHNFPNLFFVNGPGGPYANNPPVAEDTARLAAELIEHSEKLRKEGNGAGVVESTAEADAEWNQKSQDCANATVFSKTSSWLFGQNVEGRTKAARFWFGGLGAWRAAFAESKAKGYEGFEFKTK